MQLDRLKDFALSLPGATVVKQWGQNLVFKVGGKMFLIVSLDGDIADSLSFKASPEDFIKLLDQDGIVPAPYLARASWVAFEDIDVLPGKILLEQIRKSYELVVQLLPKKLRASIVETRSG